MPDVVPGSLVPVVTPTDYLTLVANPIGGGTPTTNITSPVVDGTVAALIANTSSGYTFSSWNPTTNITNPSSSSTTVAIYGNMTITANYNPDCYLSYFAGSNGTLNGSTSQVVAYGSNGTAVTAIPSPCYYFVGWNDSSIQNPRVDTNVTSNVSVLANFSSIVYTLSYSAGPGGSISNNSSQTVACGGNGSTVTAVPSAGYGFSNWSDGSSQNPRTDTNVSQNISVTANFSFSNFDVILGIVIMSFLILLALGLTFISLKVRLILFRLAASLCWLSAGIYMLVQRPLGFDISQGWTQVLGIILIVMTFAPLTLQLVVETRHTTKDGRSYTTWGRMKKKKMTKAEVARERQEQYKKDFRDKYMKR
jgi:hypothetical protein